MRNGPTIDADKKAPLLQQLTRFQREILQICGQAVAPVFQIRAIREYSMRRAAPAAGFWTEDYPALEAKHLDNPRLFANREDLISAMRSVQGGCYR
jgi:hypothetical protein